MQIRQNWHVHCLLLILSAFCFFKSSTCFRGVVTRATKAISTDFFYLKNLRNKEIQYPYFKSSVEVANASTSTSKKSFNPRPIIKFSSTGKKINLFGFFYGTIALGTGLVWYLSLLVCQALYKVGFKRIDKLLSFPNAVGYIWVNIVLRLTNSMPIVYGRENLQRVLHKKAKNNDIDKEVCDGNTGNNTYSPMIIVANHCSWMDIPFVVIAMENAIYKAIVKDDLSKVPILSKTLQLSNHMLLNNKDRKSQISVLRKGLSWLQQGVNLLIFPEGKLSRTGHLTSFKRGAFALAEKENVPIVPVAVSYSHRFQPHDYVFPVRPARSLPVTVQVLKPIWSRGRGEDGLIQECWSAIADHLPESQKPKVGTSAIEIEDTKAQQRPS